MSNHTVTTAYDTESARGTARVHGPATAMKAWQIGRFGLEALEQIERRTPQPGPHELLVRVGAASLNFRDRLVIDGTFLPDLALPFVPASDGAGEVVAVGKDVTRFRVGDRVIGTYIPKWIDGDGHGPDGDYVSRGGPLPGVLAEYVAFDEHAAVPAWTALFEHRRLRPGDTVLVEGTGGVSIFALQLAVAAGARVIVTSSSDEKLERAKALGASDTINYARYPAWDEQVRELTSGHGADYIIEVVGGDNVRRAANALARNGHLALVGLMGGFTLTADIMPMLVERRAMRGVIVGSRRNFEDLNRALELLRLHPVIDRVYPFDDAPAAFAHLTRGAFGKIVIDVRGV
jgi:NADPH:quinone reductase-like Zn-dependent oxidoreductase